MATVEHSALTGSNLHEPKGASTATVGTVYVSDGIGSGSFTTLGLSSLASTAKAFEAQLMHVQDQKSTGNVGGTFTAGAFRTRTINTVLTNEISSASLAANQITLPAGTYFIQASAPAYNCNDHKLKLRNITDGADTLIGGNVSSNTTAGINATVNGRFTIASAKVFELQHRCSFSSGSTDGMGRLCGYSVTEVYAEALIWKIA